MGSKGFDQPTDVPRDRAQSRVGQPISSRRCFISNREYVVYMSNRMMVAIILGSAILGLLLGLSNQGFLGCLVQRVVCNLRQSALMEVAREKLHLPVVVQSWDEKTPATCDAYFQRRLANGLSATRNGSSLNRRPEEGAKNDCKVEPDGSQMCEKQTPSVQPIAQHLLVDIAIMDSSFLNSEERLTKAILLLASKGGLRLLTHRCHKLEPSEVSCFYMLLTGCVSLHSWPDAGIITLDLFTSRMESLIPLLSAIEKIFGVSTDQSTREEKANMKWAYKRRGFRTGEEKYNNEEVDFYVMLLGDMRLDKTPVASIQTDFQLVEFYDIDETRSRLHMGPRRRSPSSDIVNESHCLHPLQLDRVVYLDHVMQSRRYGEVAYHEELVHPAMFLHNNPRRVAIIGGGEGATLREVLKHKTVEKVVMIEIDEMMVNASKTFIPEWSDCSNNAGSTNSCFDDPRAEVYYEDAIAWFIDSFSEETDFDDSKDGFDVVIMDALDPSSVVEFSDMLYDNQDLMDTVSNALGEEGVFVAQIGEANDLDEPPMYLSKDTSFASFLKGLEDAGFESIVGYDDAHGGFRAEWHYIVAMKDRTARSKWFSNEAEVVLAIRRRLFATRNGEEPLRYFDGATMADFQFDARVEEEVWCRQEPKPLSCSGGHGFDPEIPNFPASSFGIEENEVTPKAGHGIFAKEDIPRGAYILLDEAGNGMFVPPLSFEVLEEGLQYNHDYWETYYSYLERYGRASDFYGGPSVWVDSGIRILVNQSRCIGTQTEATDQEDMQAVYDPASERHFPGGRRFNTLTALRDIPTGQDLFDDKLFFPFAA